MILELGGIPDRDLLELETEAVMDAAVPCSWRRRALSAAIAPRRRELAQPVNGWRGPQGLWGDA